MHYPILLFTFLWISNLAAQNSPVGIWKAIDDNDDVAKSHIEIFEQDGRLYGKVVRLLEAATLFYCEKCKGEKRDKPILNMIILRDLEPNGDIWDGGKILDPAKGKEYSCLIELIDADKLKVRGYIGLPMLGRTQYWYRVKS